MSESNSPSPTRSDGLPQANDAEAIEELGFRQDALSGDKVQCNACPVLCQISEGRTGACDRYSNEAGQLVRLSSVVFLKKQQPLALESANAQQAFQARLHFEDGFQGDEPQRVD